VSSDDPSGLSVGAVLRQLRRRLGLSGQTLADRVGMSQAKVSRIENGVVGADPADVLALARALDMPEDEANALIQRIEHQADRPPPEWLPVPAQVAARQRDMASLEMSTVEFRVFQPTLVFGLLQTSEYARAILSYAKTAQDAGRGSESTTDVAAAVTARVRRHEILEDGGRRFDFVMSETVLTNRLCRPHDMVAQIERLREAAAQRNVTLRVIPADTRWPMPPLHGFEVMDDRRVLVDLFNTTLMSRARSVVRTYRGIFDSLKARSTTDVEPILDRYADVYLDLSRRSRGHL
jgi:transcriptional regulator with XRE-family HTH domain